VSFFSETFHSDSLSKKRPFDLIFSQHQGRRNPSKSIERATKSCGNIRDRKKTWRWVFSEDRLLVEQPQQQLVIAKSAILKDNETRRGNIVMEGIQILLRYDPKGKKR
jgi:hypothetical protein